MNGWIRAKKMRENFLSWLGNSCSVPGCQADDLHFAHLEKTEVNGRGRGSYKRMNDVRHNFGAYILLCEEHHKIFDSEIDA